MEQSVESLHPRKRSARDLASSVSEEAPAKRACVDLPSASPHLTLLEELYDLEGEDEGVAMEAPLSSSTQEDLVAEMMKSLEKVIEEVEGSRGEGEASTSNNPSGYASPEVSAVLDFSWSNEEIGELPASPQGRSFNGELDYEEDFKEDAQIRQLLEASDDELGLPMSSSSSDLEESSFHEEWASLTNEGSANASFNWLDATFNQFEEPPALSKEIFEPLLLF